MKAVILTLPLFLHVCLGDIEGDYTKHYVCHVQDKLNEKCAGVISTKIRSMIECLALCDRRDACLGASMTKPSSCYLFQECAGVYTCTDGEIDKDHIYYDRGPCRNKGTWSDEKAKCICVNGWLGLKCDELPTSCTDLDAYGYPTGVYSVTFDLSAKKLPNVPVTCFIQAGAYSVVYVMKSSGDEDNRRTWEDYKNGFNNGGVTHIWLGLEKWHVLSEAGYNKLIVKAYFHAPSLLKIAWVYEIFKLGDESTRYAYVFNSSFSMPNFPDYRMEDCLDSFVNVPFSTYDSDADLVGTNCATDRGAGWWYTDCNSPCNLFGTRWGSGVTVPDNELIRIKGIDMKVKGTELQYIEMYLLTP